MQPRHLVVVRTSKPGDKKERRRSVNLKRKGMGHVGSAIMQPKGLTCWIFYFVEFDGKLHLATDDN